MTRQLLMISAAIIAATTAASACGSGKMLFSDTFDNASDAWKGLNGPVVMNGGDLVLTVEASHYTQASTTQTFNNSDFCATLKLTDSKNPSSTYGGLTFWSPDENQFYTFQITLDGYATVYQYAHDDWTSLVDDRQVDSIKQGLNAENELRVITQGGTATLYINDVKFDTVTGTAMPAQHLGFTVQGPDESGATFAVDKVEVRAVEGAPDDGGGDSVPGHAVVDPSAINGGGPSIKP